MVASHPGEAQRQKDKIRYICHLEPRNRIESWGFRGEGRKSQADKRSGCQ